MLILNRTQTPNAIVMDNQSIEIRYKDSARIRHGGYRANWVNRYEEDIAYKRIFDVLGIAAGDRIN